MTAPIRLATRGSALAVAQASQYADQLAAQADRPVVLVTVTTHGDVTTGTLASMGGLGVFVGAVRECILAGEADVAVHSLKDVPTVPVPGLELVAIPKRENPLDVLVSQPGRGLESLPEHARVGTGSPRRKSQLLAHRPDLTVVDIRGNVDTRIRRVSDGDLTAVVLAQAGLTRLGRVDVRGCVLDENVMLPAPGQGALAVEMADSLVARDPDLHKSVVRTDDLPTRLAVTSERAVLSELEAGCSAPVGALARVLPGQSSDLRLTALIANDEGSKVVRKSISGTAREAEALGRQLGGELLSASGGGQIGSPGVEHEGAQG